MKRSVSPPTSAKGKWRCPDPAFAKAYPTLAEGLCDLWWDDGKPRCPWALSLHMDGDSVFISIQDKDARQSLYTNAETVEEGLKALDAILREGKAQWRRWKK